MNLLEEEETVLLRDSARRLLSERYSFAKRRSIIESGSGFDAGLWREFAELGWLGLPLPETCGGLDGSAEMVCALMEAFGGALVIEPYLPTVLLGARCVARLGSARQQAALLPAVSEGKVQLALAHAEPHAAIDAIPRMSAVRYSDHWQLSGNKCQVLNAAGADMILVSARISDGPQGTVGVFQLPAKNAGLHRDDYAMLDDRRASDLRFDAVKLPLDAVLGEGEDAQAGIEALLDAAIIAQSADMLGAAEVLVNSTFDYARTRQQFGKPLASFQALQHRMAEMAVLLEEVRSALLLAVLSEGLPASVRARRVSSAKAKIGRCVRYISQQAVQIHGAMGVTEELAIGAYFKRALAYETRFGHSDAHLRRYAQLCQTTPLRDSLLVA